MVQAAISRLPVSHRASTISRRIKQRLFPASRRTSTSPSTRAGSRSNISISISNRHQRQDAVQHSVAPAPASAAARTCATVRRRGPSSLRLTPVDVIIVARVAVAATGTVHLLSRSVSTGARCPYISSACDSGLRCVRRGSRPADDHLRPILRAGQWDDTRAGSFARTE